MRFRFYSGLMVAMLLIMPIGGINAAQNDQAASGASGKGAAKAINHTMKDIDGKDVNLAQAYKGKVLLIVNVASKCGYTKQYAGLQALQEKYADKGLVVLGFPCNQFGGQEPGTEEDIKQFCSTKYNVSFPLFTKVDVNGENAAPLYKDLTTASSVEPGPVKWNFEKFLVGRDGQVIARYRSKTTPESDELTSAIEAALAK